MTNAINWFEIPAHDLDRATLFYETVLGVALKREIFGGEPIAIFAAPDPSVGGAIVARKKQAPGAGGTRVYVAADGKIDACLARVAKAGGQVLLPKTDIGEPGFIAMIEDTEGNVVGLNAGR
jgi:predicted enzyme related to lactoylglutathione lyase